MSDDRAWWVKFPLTELMLAGLKRTNDARGIENGLVSWIDRACEEIAAGRLSDYYRHELGQRLVNR